METLGEVPASFRNRSANYFRHLFTWIMSFAMIEFIATNAQHTRYPAANGQSLLCEAVSRTGKSMLNTIWAVVHNGRIEPLDKITAPEGTRVLVTLLLEDEADFWLNVSSGSLDDVWDNAEDDRYGELLET